MGWFNRAAEREAAEAAARRQADAEHRRRMAESVARAEQRMEEPYQHWRRNLPDPDSETLETGVERALAAMWSQTYTDLIRADCVRMVRQHAQPGEQVLAILYEPRWRGQPALIAVVVTGGIIARVGTRTFRTQWTGAKEIGGVSFWTTSDYPFEFAVRYQEELQQAQQAQLNDDAAADAGGGDAPSAGRSPDGVPPKPAARLIRTSRDAEIAAAEWMAYLGYTDVFACPPGADGGIDVTSAEALAQVKAETRPTGRPVIQQHHGVCTAASRQALFFSLAGYTPAAAAFADQVDMALFGFNLACEVEPLNGPARRIFNRTLT